ncbi:MAG: F0F1 ATP synthase subunit delta [Endomicrobium sp.]|jgi:F-type H+-transporting ATPase subunit delta|nr:F0F1 ATP synthase subunit delta [Endomicrobium sp.]
MKKLQIKELTKSIVKHDEFSEENLKWVFENFSRKELKLFKCLLLKEIKNNNVTVSFTGKLNDENKTKINAMFPNRQILFKCNDKNIFGGLRFEYNDFILDYSISGILKKILNNIRERI